MSLFKGSGDSSKKDRPPERETYFEPSVKETLDSLLHRIVSLEDQVAALREQFEINQERYAASERLREVAEGQRAAEEARDAAEQARHIAEEAWSEVAHLQEIATAHGWRIPKRPSG